MSGRRLFWWGLGARESGGRGPRLSIFVPSMDPSKESRVSSFANWEDNPKLEEERAGVTW